MANWRVILPNGQGQYIEGPRPEISSELDEYFYPPEIYYGRDNCLPPYNERELILVKFNAFLTVPHLLQPKPLESIRVDENGERTCWMYPVDAEGNFLLEKFSAGQRGSFPSWVRSLDTNATEQQITVAIRILKEDAAAICTTRTVNRSKGTRKKVDLEAVMDNDDMWS